MLLGTVPYNTNSIAFLYGKVSTVSLKNSRLLRKLVFFPVIPADYFEQPFFAKVRRDHRVLFRVVSRDELVKESKELVNLLLGEISIVTSIFHFKSVSVLTFSSHKVWQRTQTRVTDWNPHGVVPIFLQELHKHGFTVKASLAPPTKFDSVNFFYHGSHLLLD
jgi:hypothetical protein